METKSCTLDEWIARKASPLEDDIRIHLGEFLPEVDVEPLLRLIMISVREWHEEN